MIRWTILPAFALLAGCGGSDAPAPEAPEMPPLPTIVKADLPGRTIFEHQCAPCHGAGRGDDGMPMLPGTMALAQKYEGQLPGQLELRTDLTGDIIRSFVRNGIGGMPMFRKAELSDADIDAIAAYLKATAEASAAHN